jgi:hypothetical protein
LRGAPISTRHTDRLPQHTNAAAAIGDLAAGHRAFPSETVSEE